MVMQVTWGSMLENTKSIWDIKIEVFSILASDERQDVTWPCSYRAVEGPRFNLNTCITAEFSRSKFKFTFILVSWLIL